MLAQADMRGGSGSGSAPSAYKQFAMLQLQLQGGADVYYVMQVALYLYLGEEKFAFEST